MKGWIELKSIVLFILLFSSVNAICESRVHLVILYRTIGKSSTVKSYSACAHAFDGRKEISCKETTTTVKVS